MNLVLLAGEIKRLEALVAIALARAIKAAGSPTAKGTNATRTSLSGIIGAGQTNTFDAPAYTPLTTGTALLIVSSVNTVSSAGDGVAMAFRVNGSPLANYSGNAHAVGGTTGSGSASAVMPIVKGVPITPGAALGNNTTGHTVATAAGGLVVTVVELQSS